MQMNHSSSCGAKTPLSPLAQATLNKHLPNLTRKRGLQSICFSKNFGRKADASCLTDICNGENLPEIEICSLIEEKIPKYRVRLDFLTSYTGYSNNDWFVPAPALLIPSCGLGLSKNQTRETLNYFLLCGNRVSQMTRAYNDIEAVTRLLEEKEKDLELTVQIGKELLTQNSALENKITELENSIKTLNEDRTQLLHELQKKSQLIAILTNDIDDNSENDTPTFSKSITLDLLQKKIASLQDENKSLKIEASQIVDQTDEVEQQERKLMEGITIQLNAVNSQLDCLSLELERQKEENRFQHEQIVNLTSQLTETQIRFNQLTQENDEQAKLLNITKENQNCLAFELVEFKTRYQEVLSLFHEAQNQLRKQTKKAQTYKQSSFVPNYGAIQSESLHSELMESSLYSENSIDSGFSGDRIFDKNTNYGICELSSQKKTFDMLRYVATHKSCDNMNLLGSETTRNYPRSRISTVSYGNNLIKDISDCCKSNTSWAMKGTNEYINSEKNIFSNSKGKFKIEDDYPSQPPGVPGAPGAKDLESALKRLSPSEMLAKQVLLSYDTVGIQALQENSGILSFGIKTPDSSTSADFPGLHETSRMLQSNWRVPEKLQIVKPIEGSQTLHNWSKLATPTLSGLLEDRPGVKIRGGRGLAELGLQVYSLSDVEEDTDYIPGKQFEAAGCIYTFTTSTVMHPDDFFSSDVSLISKSQMSSRLASVSTSRQPSCASTPNTCLSRRNSCSTFSVYMGLASVLNERGIKAVTPSALNTPTGQNFSPTTTPCNSPENSSPVSSPPDSVFSFLLLGAEKIRKKISCEKIKQSRCNQQKIMLSRLEKRALRSLKLVEKVESIGLENIITIQPNSAGNLVNGIANRNSNSSTHLIELNQNSLISNDGLQFNRDQIKCVLNKGLAVTQNFHNNDQTKDVADLSNLRSPKHQSENDLCKEENDKQLSGRRFKQIPRQKTRRINKNSTGGQRQDLGTIDLRVHKDLENMWTVKENNLNYSSKNSTTKSNKEEKSYIKQSVVGSISSLLFGRKGGWF